MGKFLLALLIYDVLKYSISLGVELGIKRAKEKQNKANTGNV